MWNGRFLGCLAALTFGVSLAGDAPILEQRIDIYDPSTGAYAGTKENARRAMVDAVLAGLDADMSRITAPGS